MNRSKNKISNSDEERSVWNSIKSTFSAILNKLSNTVFMIFFLTDEREDLFRTIVKTGGNESKLKDLIKNESYICSFCLYSNKCYGHKRRKIGSDHCIEGVKKFFKQKGIDL